MIISSLPHKIPLSGQCRLKINKNMIFNKDTSNDHIISCAQDSIEDLNYMTLFLTMINLFQN